MEMKDMKYSIQLEVDKRVRAELHEKKINRQIEMVLIILVTFVIGYVLAKIQW